MSAPAVKSTFVTTRSGDRDMSSQICIIKAEAAMQNMVPYNFAELFYLLHYGVVIIWRLAHFRDLQVLPLRSESSKRNQNEIKSLKNQCNIPRVITA